MKLCPHAHAISTTIKSDSNPTQTKDSAHPTFRGWGKYMQFCAYRWPTNLALRGQGQCTQFPAFSGGGGTPPDTPTLRRWKGELVSDISETTRPPRAVHCPNPQYHLAEASTSRQTEVFPSKLGGNHPGPLGLGGSNWAEIDFHTQALSVRSTSYEGLLRGTGLHLRGNSGSSRERSHSPGTTGRGGAVLPLLRLHSTKKGWGKVPHHQLKVTEQVYSTPSLQDGKHPVPQGHNPAGGLYDQTRPKGCILLCSNPPQFPEISLLSIGGKNIQVH